MPPAKGAHSSMETAPCPRRWGPRFLQILLLGSMLYAALTLGWVICSVHSTDSQGDAASMGFSSTVFQKVHRPMMDALQKVKDKVEEMQRTPSPQQLEALEHARSVPNLPSGDMQWRNITCIGWRATGNCKSDGPREFANDLACDQQVPDGSSGPVNYHIEARKRIRSRLIKQGIHKIPTEEEVVAELKIMKKRLPPTLEPAEPDGIADQAIWTHMLSFRKDAPRSEYKVKSFSAPPYFPEKQRCYGEREFARSKYFDMQRFADLSFSGLETHVRRFAMEAAQIRHG
ncbi:hypothetical protein PC114_g11271 [Phytophthora cactorum]|nr:hypothetical protein PC114_g11271 [Phytophthora cactorum]